jgi:hypothetical protein
MDSSSSWNALSDSFDREIISFREKWLARVEEVKESTLLKAVQEMNTNLEMLSGKVSSMNQRLTAMEAKLEESDAEDT